MTHCHHHDAPDPHSRPTMSLEAESLFVVGVLRAWVAAHQPKPAEGPEWRQIFGLASLPPEAAAAFGSFMTLVRQSLRRPLDIRCCPCPQLGRDEEALLRILGAVQSADRLGALDELGGWLQPGNLTMALRSADRLASLLAQHDVRLPRASIPAEILAGHAAGQVLQ